MYKIMCTVLENGVYVNKEIYNDTSDDESKKLINPVLEMEDSTAGTLTMTLPITNVAHDTLQRMSSDVTVLKNNEEIWWGRVLSEETDFWNNRKVTCEGALSFLNDVLQPLHDYGHIFTPARSLVSNLLDAYNANVGNKRKIYINENCFDDQTYAYWLLPGERYSTNYETTLEWIRKVAEELKFHILIRKENNAFYLYLLRNYLSSINQTINFGENLLDFSRKWNNNDFATVIVPLGEKISVSETNDLDIRLTIEGYQADTHHEAGSIYLTSNVETISTYGRIEKVVTFDDESDVTQLYAKGLNYLEDAQYEKVELEVTAIDLSYLNVDRESMQMLHQVHVVSAPHSMDRYFPITKMSIPLDEPENAKFTLGRLDIVPLSNSNGRIEQIVKDQFKNFPDTTTILAAAQARATEVMNRMTNGYITLHEAVDEFGRSLGYVDAIYISDTENLDSATKVWKWSMDGLGYAESKDGQGQWQFRTAMTMDGQIVADFVSTGVLSADLLTAGTIRGRDIYLYQTLYDSWGNPITGYGGCHVSFWGYTNDGDVDQDGNPIYNPHEYGALYLDDNGDGNNFSKHRVFLRTTSGTALKLYSGKGLSLESEEGLYMYSNSGGVQINGSYGNIDISTSGTHSEEVTEEIIDYYGNTETITHTVAVPYDVLISSRDGSIRLHTGILGGAYVNDKRILTEDDVPDVIAKFG